MTAVKFPPIKAEVALAIAAGVVGLYLVYKIFNTGEKVADAAADAGKKVYEALADDKNPIYDGVVGGAVRAVTGNKDASLGTWFYDFTHPGSL